MRISEILRTKGDAVVTIEPDASVRQLLATLAEHNIGAVVVSGDASAIDGIVSERDIVRRLNEDSAAILDAPVSSIMTVHVRTCAPRDDVDGLRKTMTE